VGSNVDSVPLNVSLAISSPSSFSKVLPFNFNGSSVPNMLKISYLHRKMKKGV